MTIQEINQGYQNTEFMTSNLLIFEVITFIVIILLLKLISKLGFGELFLPTVILTAIVTVCWMFASVPDELEKRDQFSEVVKEEYIDKLDIHKVEVLDYKVIQETEVSNNPSFFTDQNKHVKIFPVELNGLEEGLEVRLKMKMEVVKVDGLKEIYLEYQLLEQNLPSNKAVEDKDFLIEFKKGYYNPVLYVPATK